MKVAFVSHMPWADAYGAATSLRRTVDHLLAADPDLHVTVLAPGNDALDSEVAQERLSIVPLALPIHMNYASGLKSPQRQVWNGLHEVTIRRIASKGLPGEAAAALGSADVVHLNSLALDWSVPLLRAATRSSNVPVVSHVREVLLSRLGSRDRERIQSLDGLVYIDGTVQRSYRSVTGAEASVPELVLPNPLVGADSLTRGQQRDWDEVIGITRESGSEHRSIVYAITGRIGPHKGFAFGAESLAAASVPDWRLVVVGRASQHWLRRGPRRELAAVTAVSSSHPGRVTYLGEIPNLAAEGFYRCVDVLIRGDEVPGAGRNVYESLAEGAVVVLPGQWADYEDDERLAACRDSVLLATPRDRASYATALEDAAALVRARVRTKPEWASEQSGDRLAADLMGFYASVLGSDRGGVNS